MRYANGVPPVAQGDNRVNTSGIFPSARGQTSLTVNNVIPANSGANLAVAGTSFYLLAATAIISIRPTGGAFNDYYPGTGQVLPDINAFANLDVYNNNNFPVAISLFIGFNGFIDNRVIISSGGVTNVAYPTYPLQVAANVIDIPDKTGQAIVDINGGLWYAVNRVSLTICNADTGVSYLLQKAGATAATDPAFAFIQPNTSYRESVAGNFRVSTWGGANINAIVNEIYAAIPRFT